MTEAGAPAAPSPGAMHMGSKPLRLRAEDAEDLAVISACLQDALVAVRDFAYDAGGRMFVLVANRFRWEGCHPGAPGATEGAPFERTLCAVTFDYVTAAAYRGFHRRDKDCILCLLTMRMVADARQTSPGLSIDLEFAGDAQIRLAASTLRCRARDFGDPWPTPWQPGHGLPAMS